MYWHDPEPIFKDRTVFIIGGGPSLSDFDFNLLRGKATIGCNDAFRLGPEICSVCYYGDYKWANVHWDGAPYGPEDTDPPKLKEFPNLIVTCCSEPLKGEQRDRIKHLRKRNSGFHAAPDIGWYTNTGMSAINLAWILGSQHVVLLGFDMKLRHDPENPEKVEGNWHVNVKDRPNLKRDVYKDRMMVLGKGVPGHCRANGIEVINANPDSLMDEENWFPKMNREEAVRRFD